MKRELKKRAIIRGLCRFLLGLLLVFAFVVTDYIGFNSDMLADAILADRFSGIIEVLLFTVLAVFYLSWIVLLYGAVYLVLAIIKDPAKGIKDFCNRAANSEAMMARLEQTWHNGIRAKVFRMDMEYIIWERDMRSAVIPLKDVLWVNFARFPTVYYLSKRLTTRLINERGDWWFGSNLFSARLIVYYNDGDMRFYKSHGYATGDVYRHLKKNCPGIVLDRDERLAKLWIDNDIEGMKKRVSRLGQKRQGKTKAGK